MLARADEDMRGGLRRNVFEGEKLWVFIEELRRQFALANFAEDAVIHAVSLRELQATTFSKSRSLSRI